MKTPVQDQMFIKTMLEKASNNEIPVERSEACKESKWTYYILITDPETSRCVIATGSEYGGDDYSWGQEIDPNTASHYV